MISLICTNCVTSDTEYLHYRRLSRFLTQRVGDYKIPIVPDKLYATLSLNTWILYVFIAQV